MDGLDHDAQTGMGEEVRFFNPLATLPLLPRLALETSRTVDTSFQWR
jgi:hypothetical protein